MLQHIVAVGKGMTSGKLVESSHCKKFGLRKTLIFYKILVLCRNDIFHHLFHLVQQ